MILLSLFVVVVYWLFMDRFFFFMLNVVLIICMIIEYIFVMEERSIRSVVKLYMY